MDANECYECYLNYQAFAMASACVKLNMDEEKQEDEESTMRTI